MHDKILTTLDIIRSSLNESFNNPDPPLVVLDAFVDANGTPKQDVSNKIVMFLANIQSETVAASYNSAKPVGNGVYGVVQPPIYINLFVVVAANFTRYEEGLDAISRSISFFQQNPTFDHENAPGLDRSIQRLTVQMCNLDSTELSHLVGLAGIRYLPLVMYKIRALPFDREVNTAIPEVRKMKSPGVD